MSAPTRVLDASAVLAVLQSERGAESVQRLLPVSVISAVSVAEVLAKLVSKGMPAVSARQALQALHVGVAPFGLAEAEASADFVGLGFALGDRACLGTAAVLGVPAVTGDHKWKAVKGAHVEVFREWWKR